MGRIVNGIVALVTVGLMVALLRQFDYDPFAAGAWAVSEVWGVISHVADLWESNDTFKEITDEPTTKNSK